MIWCGLKIIENCHVLVNQFHGNIHSKILVVGKLKSVFRDVKWCFNASWGLKGWKDFIATFYMLWVIQWISLINLFSFYIETSEACIYQCNLHTYQVANWLALDEDACSTHRMSLRSAPALRMMKMVANDIATGIIKVLRKFSFWNPIILQMPVSKFEMMLWCIVMVNLYQITHWK